MIHQEIYKWKSISFCLMICLILMIACLLVMYLKMKRCWQNDINMLNHAHRQYVNIENLCAAVSDQEHIIRRELPLTTVSWKGNLREVCSQ